MPGASQAATSTGSFLVSLTIAAQCALVAATPLTFGSSGVISAPIDATSAITVLCTAGTSYNIALNLAGSETTHHPRDERHHHPGQPGHLRPLSRQRPRQRLGQTNRHGYRGSSGTGLPQIFTVYGRVPVQTPAGTDLYTQTVNVTVTLLSRTPCRCG